MNKSPEIKITNQDSLPLGLAPMEGVTDYPVRLWYQLIGGMDFQWTPFLRVTPTFPLDGLPENFVPELTHPALRPLYPTGSIKLQLMASDPKRFIEAARLCLEHTKVIDLNLGCPAPKVVGHGAGSSLLSDLDCLKNFLKEVVSEIDPSHISLKLRTGFNCESDFDSILNIVEKYRFASIALHGRTRSQKYQGNANWELIHRAASRLTSPLIGSGDILHFTSYQEKISPGSPLAGSIIGRGALRNPFIFHELKNNGKTIQFLKNTLIELLQLYYNLHVLYYFSPSKLYQIAATAIQTKSTSCYFWESPNFASVLKETDPLRVSPELTFEHRASRRSLCRLKLIWNYLRGSLEGCFEQPMILRSKSIQEFLARLDSTIISNTKNLSFRPNLNHNWVYSGAKKPVEEKIESLG